jgi:carbamoyl-phosphate synthase large subunit
VVDLVEAGEVDLVVNTPTGSGARTDGWEIRRAAVARGIPCLTTLSGGMAAARAIAAAGGVEPPVIALQDLHAGSLAEGARIPGGKSRPGGSIPAAVGKQESS